MATRKFLLFASDEAAQAFVDEFLRQRMGKVVQPVRHARVTIENTSSQLTDMMDLVRKFKGTELALSLEGRGMSKQARYMMSVAAKASVSAAAAPAVSASDEMKPFVDVATAVAAINKAKAEGRSAGLYLKIGDALRPFSDYADAARVIAKLKQGGQSVGVRVKFGVKASVSADDAVPAPVGTSKRARYLRSKYSATAVDAGIRMMPPPSKSSRAIRYTGKRASQDVSAATCRTAGAVSADNSGAIDNAIAWAKRAAGPHANQSQIEGQLQNAWFNINDVQKAFKTRQEFMSAALAKLKGTASAALPEHAPKPPIPDANRDLVKPQNFAGPHESFPVRNQSDFDRAVRSLGRAQDPEAVKAKLKSIAKRRGYSLPDDWKDGAGASVSAGAPYPSDGTKTVTIPYANSTEAAKAIQRARQNNVPVEFSSGPGPNGTKIFYVKITATPFDLRRIRGA